MSINNSPKFGDVFFASLSTDEHIQGGLRPVIITQNNVGNIHSPTVEIIPMSAQVDKAKYMPTHTVLIANATNGLSKDSVVLAEQIRTIPVKHLREHIGALDRTELTQVARVRRAQSPLYQY